jgi:hypothetical protein
MNKSEKDRRSRGDITWTVFEVKRGKRHQLGIIHEHGWKIVVGGTSGKILGGIFLPKNFPKNSLREGVAFKSPYSFQHPSSTPTPTPTRQQFSKDKFTKLFQKVL